ncbi:FKBP-type peptidyl-prolyl cis-trans isomerase [Mucilaginibacter lacusdianchii]|uniref:FKBP-type peptidyl-prolyl cis-trans isomerase n=1 Tax=Mucilaginibacter lacusdianchii TaxID=2684211 RepID=UPI00131C5722|nr:FKBP-type peptidyl-prolyl cis-trans isomerase [Mucilaginibacter sp. JXJ CY 39]
MKLTYLTLCVLLTLGFVSCRKDKQDIGIKEFDEQQITAYIKANGLNNMKRADGDTSGIYYEILNQGTGATLRYQDTIAYTFSINSLDGLYNSTDTVFNHGWSFVGQLIPSGVQQAVYNLVKTKGTRARFLIPSRLAYGSSGFGNGSSRLRGNQSLYYYINVINNQDAYDDACIQSYFKNTNSNPAEYTKITSGRYAGLYYKIRKAGTGTTLINETSTVAIDYKGSFLNGTVFDPSNYSENNNASPATYDLNNPNALIPGFREALLLAKNQGTDITVIVPSRLAYGRPGSVNPTTRAVVIPSNSVLIFDVTINTVTNP